MLVSAYSLLGMKLTPKAKPGTAIHTFTRAHVAAGEWREFAAAFAVEARSPETLREAYNSLVIQFTGFDLGPRALYEDAEARAFVCSLHEQWPYWLFFLNIPGADLKTYALCRLTTLVVESRGTGASKVDFSRNELFQLLGRDFDALERACQRAELGPVVFRNRARQVLKFFGVLKGHRS